MLLNDDAVAKSIGATIKGVEVLTGDDSGSTEYCAYRIRVQTDRGVLEFFGYHDLTPDAAWVDEAKA